MRLLKMKEAKKSNKKFSLYVYAAAVLLLGAGIMAFGNLFGTADSPDADINPVFGQEEQQQEDTEVFGRKGSAGIQTTRDYEKYLQTEMKDVLEDIAGVDDVKVMVYVESTEKNIYEKNKVTQKQVTDETDREGGKRTVEDTSIDEQLVLIKNNDKEGPIIAETQKPKVSGVLVVAKGADNIQIKKWIMEAVTRALDVPNHRVSVLPKK